MLEFYSVKQFSIEEDWKFDSEVMRLHQRHSKGMQNLPMYVNDNFRQPKDFKSFLYATMVMQSWAI
jgi:beta-mannosidase